MTLEKALAKQCASVLDSRNDWYEWPILGNHLPDGIVLPEGNAFSQTLALKSQLSTLYANADAQKRTALTRYYIFRWGGVRGNSDERYRSYAHDQPSALISRGVQGVASWSKALNMREPAHFAIYDARVAASINSLQVIEAVETPTLFPLLQTKNGAIKIGNEALRKHAGAGNWQAINKSVFYQTYNQLLATVAQKLNVSTTVVEMFLFARSVDFLRSAFPRQEF